MGQASKAAEALAEAHGALGSGDEEALLDALIAAWRALRATELAELVELQSARLSPLVPPVEGNLEAFQPAWLALARQRRAAHLPMLLDTALHTTHRFGTAVVAALLERGEALESWPPDPRTGAAVVRHLTSGGYESTSKSTLPFWTSLLAMLRTHDDPRTLELLRPIRFARVFRTFSDGKRRIAWFQGEVDALVEHLAIRHADGPPKLPKELASSAGRLRAALSGKRPVGAAARARLSEAPPPAAPPKAPERAPRAPRGAAGEHLKAAERARGESQRLSALLTAWRAKPAPEIAALVERVSRRLEARLPRIRGVSRQAAQAAWLATAGKRDPADLPRLLESITDTRGRSTDALARVQALASWPPDPRTAAHVAAQLEAPPFHSTSANPFWSALIDLARRHGDRGAAPWLEGVSSRFDRILADRYTDRSAQVSWFRRRLDAAVAELAALPGVTLDAGEAAACGRLSVAIGDAEDALLRGIAEHPDDDAPRHVYADWLLERGDPRGELIALQLSQADGARAAELVRNHAYTWVEGLGPFVELERCRFERGFLAHVEVRPGDPARLEGVAEARVWATVRSVHLGDVDVPQRFLVTAAMRSLERVTYETRAGRRALKLGARPRSTR